MDQTILLIMEQPTTAVALDSVADLKRLLIGQACTVIEVGVIIEVAKTATDAGVFDFDRRITPGSDVGRIDQGVTRLTFPATTQVAGRIVRKEVQVDLDAGDEVVFAGVTSAGAGSPTGVPYMRVRPRAVAAGDNGDNVTGT